VLLRWLVLFLLVAGAFALGRATGADPAAAKARSDVFTLRDGDVALGRAAATRCTASGKGGFPDLFCERAPGGRYQVAFFRDSIVVWRVGRDNPVFSARWQP
jgi:hypothetical protein